MNPNILGRQIQKYRKGLDMTQKELGKAIGVSTQAVSQWECGGTPDVSLLPAIADTLKVTVDALFGREGGEMQDMSGALARWLLALPENDRYSRLTKLIWEASLCSLEVIPSIGYPEECECTGDLFPGNPLKQTEITTEGGYMLGVGAEDMSFISIFPEPEEGYERYLLENDEYRTYLEALAMPGCLEVLRFFYRNKPGYMIPAVAAKQVGMSLEETEKVFETLVDVQLLQRTNLMLEEGEVNVYRADGDRCSGFVPLLQFLRWMCKKDIVHLLNWVPRSRFCLDRGNKKNNRKEDSNEKKLS